MQVPNGSFAVAMISMTPIRFEIMFAAIPTDDHYSDYDDNNDAIPIDDHYNYDDNNDAGADSGHRWLMISDGR